MQALIKKLPVLSGEKLGNYEVSYADEFRYEDPIDKSISEHQGIRIGFTDGSRVVYRLSGTGTKGATLRVYLEAYTTDDTELEADAHKLLEPLAVIAENTALIKEFTQMEEPTVIT